MKTRSRSRELIQYTHINLRCSLIRRKYAKFRSYTIASAKNKTIDSASNFSYSFFVNMDLLQFFAFKTLYKTVVAPLSDIASI